MTDPTVDQTGFRYLIDENVSASAVNVLRAFGREILESRNVIGIQASDKVLEWVAYRHNCFLVTGTLRRLSRA